MKNTILAFLATVGLAITACDNAGNKSTTGFVEAALMPYVESGQLAGAISVLYNDGVEAVAYGVPGLTAQSLVRAASRYVPIEGSLLLRN